MYIAKVYLNNQLINVNHYEDYEHFLSDLISADADLICYLPEEKISETKFAHPAIVSGGRDNLGFECDLEYRYDSGVTVYCGTMITAEELRK